MAAQDLIRTKKIGFLGVGNLGQAVLRGFLDSGLVLPKNVLISSRTERKLAKVAEEFNVQAVKTNEELIDGSDVVIIGVKPQDLYLAIEPIASSFHEDHVVMSLAAGISLESLEELMPDVKKILRVMPNTAANVKKSVVAYSASDACSPHLNWIEELLSTIGVVVPVEDGDMMEALVVAASSGIGFVYELMIYWQEWLEERGIDRETAKLVTVNVFAGASAMASSAPNTSFEELQRKVTSLKGVTAAGLDSMRELEIERALRISFEKAALRDKSLGDSWLKSN
ncbi:MAG: pyrroline-5-carboxylate reductase [Bdellovibrionales bacterium]|nr:pyrroline-5-carboxylate reductase [Bdellovibrionales bacterium]